MELDEGNFEPGWTLGSQTLRTIFPSKGPRKTKSAKLAEAKTLRTIDNSAKQAGGFCFGAVCYLCLEPGHPCSRCPMAWCCLCKTFGHSVASCDAMK